MWWASRFGLESSPVLPTLLPAVLRSQHLGGAAAFEELPQLVPRYAFRDEDRSFYRMRRQQYRDVFGAYDDAQHDAIDRAIATLIRMIARDDF